MSKHKKHGAPDPKEPLAGASGNYWSVKPELSELENRLTNDEFVKAKKEISGVWVLLFLVGLLILLVVQHWLRQ
jgi:hypothetical protein